MNSKGWPAIIDWLLSTKQVDRAERFPEFSQWQPVFMTKAAAWEHPMHRAMAGGFLSDRLAYAFTAGYQAALARLRPTLPPDTLAAFCVTEAGGGHPKAVKTTLTPAGNGHTGQWRLHGSKTFVSNALEANRLLVAASTGRFPDGRNKIRMVDLSSDTRGVTVTAMPELPLIPEISHGTLGLTDVKIEDAQILEGDGYEHFIKPFRTLEDLHVSAAVLGYLFRVARLFDWPKAVLEELLGLMVTLTALAGDLTHPPAAHIVLGGALRQIKRLAHQTGPLWEKVDSDLCAAWKRDRQLLRVAGSAKARRLETAWSFYDAAP